MAYKEWGAVILKPGCQNNCLFCRMIPRVDKRELRKQELNVARNLVDLKMQGVEKIDISGNDPIEYAKIVPLIKYIHDFGFSYIQLSTHGRNLANEKLLENMTSSPLKKLRIPLYGSKPGTHDAVTQAPGSFDETIRGIRGILERSNTIEIQASFLIIQQNRDDIVPFLQLMDGLGVRDVYISIPFIKNNDYSYYIPLKDLARYTKPALAYIRKKGLAVKFMEIPYCVFEDCGDEIDNSVQPPNMGEHCQPRKEFNTGIKDLPSYRIKKKLAFCNECVCSDRCDGFVANDIDTYTSGGLKAILNA